LSFIVFVFILLQAPMRSQRLQLVWGILFAPALTLAFAQTADTQLSGIEAALHAKANAGDAASQVAVGECYAAGKDVPRDLKAAAEWYRKAADKGDVAGEMHLAALYRDGGGKTFPRDMVQAAEWYRKAAEQGDVTAQGILGTLYSMGQGVPLSYPDAYYWLDLAAHVKGPNQEKYAANRQLIGAHITADELTDVQDRVEKWLAAHPR
jgi:TPR repeat protein